MTFELTTQFSSVTALQFPMQKETEVTAYLSLTTLNSFVLQVLSISHLSQCLKDISMFLTLILAGFNCLVTVP